MSHNRKAVFVVSSFDAHGHGDQYYYEDYFDALRWYQGLIKLPATQMAKIQIFTLVTSVNRFNRPIKPKRKK